MTNNKAASRPPVREQAIAPVHASDRGVAMKPSAITQALRALDAGDVYPAALIFDEMEEKDFHAAAVMQTRVSGVSGMEMTLTPSSGDQLDQEISAKISQIFWDIPNLYSTLHDLLLTGLGHGAALCEIYWVVRDETISVERLAVRDPRWLRYDDQEVSGRLVDFPRWVTRDNSAGEELDRRRFLYFTPLAGRRHPVRSGLYRGLVWLWLFSSYTVKDWLAFNELYGQPMRVGKYGTNATLEEREAVLAAVRRLGSDAAAIIDSESAIEFIHAQSGGGSAYSDALNFFNAEKSKRVLGQTLTTEAGGGSYAQARVHDGVRRGILVADARRLEETINRDLIRPLVDYNFGPGHKSPCLTIQTDMAPEVGAILDNAAKIKSLGFDISEIWLREQTGLPAPTPDEIETDTDTHNRRKA